MSFYAPTENIKENLTSVGSCHNVANLGSVLKIVIIGESETQNGLTCKIVSSFTFKKEWKLHGNPSGVFLTKFLY